MKKKINILFVNPSLFIGGAEIVIKNLCYYLEPDEFNVSICCLKEIGTIGEELCQEGFDVQNLSKPKKSKDVNYFSSKDLFKVVDRKHIDLIHSHATHSLVDSCICKFFHSIRQTRIPVVHTFHSADYPIPKKSRDLLERIFWRFADKLVAVGNHQKKQLQGTYHIPEDKIVTIWNGVSALAGAVDNDAINFLKKCKGTIIGTIATLYKQKGITYLLDTATILKKQGYDVVFVVAGEGPLRAELEEKIQYLGLEDTVYLLGWVQNASQNILPYIDIFFQPSLWEAMSIVVLEAMMAGKPLVVTDVGENRFVIDHGINGFLVEPRAVDQMALLLEKMICDIELRQQIGHAAKGKYKKHFTAPVMAKIYEKLYLEVLGQ